MPSWEACQVVIGRVGEIRKQGGGIFGGEEETFTTLVWAAELFRPDGTTEWIAETDGWENRYVRNGGDSWDRDAKEEQLTGIIAELALDGWEPMPLVIVGGGAPVTSGVHWYFKRPISDNRPSTLNVSASGIRGSMYSVRQDRSNKGPKKNRR